MFHLEAKIISNLYPDGHPYSWSTIGYYKDIESYTLDDVRSFFQQYYSPANAAIVIAGNFEVNKTKLLLEKYFGEIKNNGIPNALKSNHTQIDESKFLTIEDKVNLERIYLAWHTQSAFNPDDAALDILSDLLTGSKNARLTRKLVYELEIAQDVSSMQFSGKYGGHFTIVATAKPGKSLDEIKKLILEEISTVSEINISKRELERSRNVIKSNFIYSLQNIDTIADMLNLYNFYLGEPNSFNFDLERYNKVNDEEIRLAAKKYLQFNYLELRIVPEGKNAN